MLFLEVNVIRLENRHTGIIRANPRVLYMDAINYVLCLARKGRNFVGPKIFKYQRYPRIIKVTQSNCVEIL